MNLQPLTLSWFPRAILHIDGDAFFASCEQSRNPLLRDKPVVTGKERGIVASLSYEAKARGVVRGMRLFEIKKICPEAILLPSDYETYSLLSQRLYNIVRRYSPEVEEYGIDECFADLTGLQRPLHLSYEKIAQKIQKELATELGFSFSIGLAPNKVVSKIASKWKKPAGLTVICGRDIHLFIKNLPVEKIWGIGWQTTAYLQKQKIFTALDLARKNEAWVKSHLSKPFYQIWQELNGKFAISLQTKEKSSYQSVQKVKTFTPPSCDPKFIFSQLSKNIENACIKIRRYKLAAKKIIIFIRSQDWREKAVELEFSRPTSFPNEIIQAAEPIFYQIFNPALLYRMTGAVLYKLEEQNIRQLDIFGAHFYIEKMTRLFDSVDQIKKKYGKHTLYLGSSFLANKFGQHLNSRGDLPQRKQQLFKGETARRRLAIPMFMGQVK